MEKRKSKRVELSPGRTDEEIQSVLDFPQSYPGAINGLLHDIGANGAQILTDKSQRLVGQSFRMIVYGDVPGEIVLLVNVKGVWSQREGALYVRNGVIFEMEVPVSEVSALQNGKSGWLHCGLRPLGERS